MLLSFSFQFALHPHPWLSIGLPSSCICDKLKTSNSSTSLQPVSSQHEMWAWRNFNLRIFNRPDMGISGQLSVFIQVSLQAFVSNKSFFNTYDKNCQKGVLLSFALLYWPAIHLFSIRESIWKSSGQKMISFRREASQQKRTSFEKVVLTDQESSEYPLNFCVASFTK